VRGLATGLPEALAGRYRLVRLLARGGMAEVWEGQDEVLGRPVAVKVLLSHLAVDPHLRERFRREAVTAARLVHPGIVAVFDAGLEALGGGRLALGTRGVPAGWLGREQAKPGDTWAEAPTTAFIVMELVAGPTLKDLIAEKAPAPVPFCLTVAAQVSEALAYAHSQGLVHRDVKPANVLLREEGPGLYRVKVTDFGIAKAAAATRDLDLTVSGTLLGTPKYISPEQVQGREPDARADLYSLGVVMYEMLAGRPPFSEGSDMATALAHVHKAAPPLSELRPDLPRDLTRLISSLLAKDPSDRPQSASWLSRELAEVSARGGSAIAGGYLSLEPQKSPLGQPSPADEAEMGEVGEVGEVLPAGEADGATSEASNRRQPAANRKARYGQGRKASVVVVSLMVLGIAAALALFFTGGLFGPSGRGAAKGPPRGASRAGALRIVRISELAVDGNKPNDNLGMLPNLTSADPSTYWASAKYLGPRFGGYGGLGLVLELPSERRVNQLTVLTPMRNWSAETFVSQSAHSALSGWGKPTDHRSGLNGSASFSLGSKTARWVLLWMLDPGPTYQAVIDKVYIH
jgi:serine/threonine protein kinase